MADPRIEELTTEEEWDAAIPILKELWTDASDEFVRSWRDEDGYRLFGLFVDEELRGVVGLSIQRVLHHARHAWIHDFVVTAAHRGEGYGSELLDFVESWAEARDCKYVALANREGNDDALEFYEGEGMERWGYVVETEL
ncbi:GNAT family N-acetyltransferase [Halorussus halophilus]|uniref:GNAT family N-acetyltransferase n=1 Tax=Halorussus halophilus TaxID=2650975 RepID=UPI001CE49EA3|nr:GNAT family N-acetyltransferase [Halorussus halophilus]